MMSVWPPAVCGSSLVVRWVPRGRVEEPNGSPVGAGLPLDAVVGGGWLVVDFGAVGPVQGRVVFLVGGVDPRILRCLRGRGRRGRVGDGRVWVAGAVPQFGCVAGGLVGGLCGGGGESLGVLGGVGCELAVLLHGVGVELLAVGQVGVGGVDPLLRLPGGGAEAVL